MELGRRGFIKGVGVLGGAVAATGFGVEAIAQAAASAKSGKKAACAFAMPLEIRKIKSGCAICPNFCGIEATVVNGVIRTAYPDAARATGEQP